MQQQVPKTILPLFIIIMIDAMSLGMITPILAPMVYQPNGLLSSYDAPTRSILFGILLGLAPLFFMIGAPVLGYLSDVFGRKNILFICITSTVATYFCYFISFKYNLLSLLIMTRICDGLTSGSQGITQAVMVDISQDKQKAARIGFIAIAMTLGLVTGPLMGGVLSDSSIVSWFNDTTPFAVAIIISAINVIIFCCTFKETNTNRQTQKSFSHFKTLLCSLLSKRPLNLLLACFFLFELAWSLYFISINLVLIKLCHFNKHMLGIFSVYIGVALSLGLLLLVRVATRRYPLIHVAMAGLMLMILSFLLLLLSSNIMAQWLIATLIALAVALVYTCLIAITSNMLPPDQQGLLLGITDGILAMAFAVSSFLSSELAFLDVELPFIVCLISVVSSAVLLIFTMVFYRIRVDHKKKEQSSSTLNSYYRVS